VNLRNGTRLGPYEIEAPIGAGGMGEVYRARDTRLDRTVAVKVLTSEFAQNAKLKLRFQREARAISALNHPHICTLYDVGDSYLVMEYCEGKTLAQRIDVGPIAVEEIVRFASQIAGALDTAHRVGITHRDLKPSNIMLTGNGVKLLDFGLAKRLSESSESAATEDMLSEVGSLIGTVQYMAPEVLRGQPADARSDIFAFGLILYEMLAGRRAFDGTSKAIVIAAILEREPAPVTELNPQTPPALDLLIRGCLEKDPEERIQTANDVGRQLRAISEGGDVAASTRVRFSSEPIAAAIRSIVVLPFENLSTPDDEQLVAGIHDGVIGELSQISALRLISRTSANHYKNTDKTIPDIARELNIEAAIEGSVVRTGTDVRLQIRLVRAKPEERQVWSKTYEDGIAGVLGLQKQIVQAIASASNVALTSEEVARLRRRRPVRPETFEAYAKGMFHIRRMTPDDVQKGLAHLKQAIENDPTDPFAYGGLAVAYSIIGHGPTPRPEMFALSKAAAQKAIQLDDGLAEAHAALAATALYDDWDWAAADRKFQRTLELNPNFAHAHRDNAWFLLLKDRTDDGIAEMKRAKELDPLAAIYTGELGWLYWSAGRLDEAIREARMAVELEPNNGMISYFAAQCLAERGLHDEAIATAERAVACAPIWKFALAYAYAKAGRTSDAEKVAAEASSAQPFAIYGWGLAEAYAAMGHIDDAIRWVEYGIETRFSWMPWIPFNPALSLLRGDPRFEAIVRDFKLPR
jgi:serine/threonine-protein kinase